MDFSLFIVAATPFILKLVDFVKYVKNHDWNGTVTQALTWTGAIGLAFLFRASDFAEQAGLADFNVYSLVIAGLALGSTASIGFDVIKAVDATQSAAKPTLLDDANVVELEPLVAVKKTAAKRKAK